MPATAQRREAAARWLGLRLTVRTNKAARGSRRSCEELHGLPVLVDVLVADALHRDALHPMRAHQQLVSSTRARVSSIATEATPQDLEQDDAARQSLELHLGAIDPALRRPRLLSEAAAPDVPCPHSLRRTSTCGGEGLERV